VSGGDPSPLPGEAHPPGAVEQEVVLATVAVGPVVRDLRSALAVLAQHARAPGLAAGPGRLDRVAWGAGQVLWAARLAWRDRALRKASLVPTLLTAVGCGVIAALYTLAKLNDGELPGGPFAAVHRYMTVLVALASMPPTLLQRQWLRVAREARRALGLTPGDDAFAGRSLIRIVVVEWVKALRQAAVVAVGLLPVVLALQLLPDAVHAPAATLGLWAFYWVVVDAFELPMEVIPGPRHAGPEPWFARLLRAAGRRWWLRPFRWAGRFGGWLARPWREELDFTHRHRWESAGLGLAAGALLSVPLLGLAFRAVAIVAATALVGRLEAGAAPATAAAPAGS